MVSYARLLSAVTHRLRRRTALLGMWPAARVSVGRLHRYSKIEACRAVHWRLAVSYPARTWEAVTHHYRVPCLALPQAPHVETGGGEEGCRSGLSDCGALWVSCWNVLASCHLQSIHLLPNAPVLAAVAWRSAIDSLP